MKAEFSQSSNDLFWKLYIDGEILRWQGYNDANWWENAPKNENCMVRTHSNGKQYRLNPRTDRVKEVLK